MQLTPREKDDVMARFRDGQADVLVATAVVEVGIDVPNASVILIEGADRFGLAQLHQFRGRVGRGPHPSSCLLLTESDAEATLARLRALGGLWREWSQVPGATLQLRQHDGLTCYYLGPAAL